MKRNAPFQGKIKASQNEIIADFLFLKKDIQNHRAQMLIKLAIDTEHHSELNTCEFK